MIFNDSKSIISLDPVSGKTEVLATPNIESGNAIFNMYVSDNIVYYLYGSDYNAEKIGSFEITFSEAPAEVPYDINGDGKVNMFDYIALKSHVLGKTLLDSDKLAHADANGDGKVNMFDYLTVKSACIK